MLEDARCVSRQRWRPEGGNSIAAPRPLACVAIGRRRQLGASIRSGAVVSTVTLSGEATVIVSGCPAMRSPRTRSGNHAANSGRGRTRRLPPGTSASSPIAAWTSAHGRGTRPRNRPAGRRVGEHRIAVAGIRSTEQLGEVVVERRGGAQQAGAQGCGDRPVPAPGKATDGDRRVVRPDRARVIAERIEAGRFGAHRAEAVSGVEIGLAHPVGDHGDLVRVQQPRRQEVTNVRCGRRNRGLRRVEGDRREPPAVVRDPERLSEPGPEGGGPRPQPVGAGATKRVEQHGAGDRGFVGVALDLAERDRGLRQGAIPELDRIARVLPALVRQALATEVDVFEEPVAVTVGVVDDPGEGCLHRIEELGDLVGRHAPAPGVVQETDPQGRRIDAAEVDRRERASGQRAADLVQHLAGRLRRLVVHPGPLPSRQGPERPAGEIRAERQGELRGPQRVSTEEGQEPGAAAGHEDVVGRQRVGERERDGIAQVPADQEGEVGRSLDRNGVPAQPARRRAEHVGRRRQRGDVEREVDLPCRPRRNLDLPHETRSRHRRVA